MASRNTLKNVEAWLEGSHFDKSEDTLSSGLTEGNDLHPNKGFLAFEDKIEEHYNIDVQSTEAKCKKMDFVELLNEYDRYKMLLELNEELITKLEQSNDLQDKKSDEIMTEHECLQEEQAVWKRKVTTASKKFKIFQDEAKSVKREHRHNVVESEIIEQFHEHCKSEIRDIVGQIEEHRETMELYNQAKIIDVGKILAESENLVDENESNTKRLASLRKELNDLKIGLIVDENETETMNDIPDSKECEENEYTNSEISEPNSSKLSGKAGLKLEKIGTKAIGLEIPTRHSPTTLRSISPETDKLFKLLKESSTDDFVTSEGVSESLDNTEEMNSYGGAINDIKNTWNSEKIVSKEEIAAQLDERGRSKTKIPRPIKRDCNSTIRCENRVKRKTEPRKDSCGEYIKLPAKPKYVIDRNVSTRATQKKERMVANKYVELNKCVKKEIVTNSDVKTSGSLTENVRTATCNPCTVSKGQSFTDHRSPRKLPPIRSQRKAEKPALTMTKLPPIKSQSRKEKSALTMANLPTIGSDQGRKLSKSGIPEDNNRLKIKTPISKKEQLTKKIATKENNMKSVDCMTGSSKLTQGKSDIQSRRKRDLSQSRKSITGNNLGKNTSAVSIEKPYPNNQRQKKMNYKITENKTDSIKPIKRDIKLTPLSNKENKNSSTCMKPTKLAPVKPKELSKKKCLTLNSVCISAPLPPIKSPTCTKKRKAQLETEKDTNPKPMKEKDNRNDLQSNYTLAERSDGNPGNSTDALKMEEEVNVVGRANNLYKRKR